METNNNQIPENPESETPETPTIPTGSTESLKPVSQSEPKTTKSSKPLIWCLAILATIGIIAAVVFAYLYFTTPATPTPTPAPNSQSSITPDEPTTTEETEITDVLLKKDLDEKIALLHFTKQTDPTIIIKKGLHLEFKLYQDALDEGAKLAHLVVFLDDYTRNASSDEKGVIASDFGLPDNKKELIYNVIDADVVKKYYKEVFGEEAPTPDNSNGQIDTCFDYRYDNSLDVFFSIGGCGGTSPYDSYYYKTKYTTDDSHAFVFIKTALLDNQDGKIYCDVAEVDNLSNAEVCGIASMDNEYRYLFDESSIKWDSLTTYRFVFNKADDGTYYFSKVEKL